MRGSEPMPATIHEHHRPGVSRRKRKRDRQRTAAEATARSRRPFFQGGRGGDRLTRGDFRRIAQAVRHDWVDDRDAEAALAGVVVDAVNHHDLKPREVIAAAHVLLAMVESNIRQGGPPAR